MQVYARVCLALLDLKPLLALRGHGALSPVEAGLGGCLPLHPAPWLILNTLRLNSFPHDGRC